MSGWSGINCVGGNYPGMAGGGDGTGYLSTFPDDFENNEPGFGFEDADADPSKAAWAGNGWGGPTVHHGFHHDTGLFGRGDGRGWERVGIIDDASSAVGWGADETARFGRRYFDIYYMTAAEERRNRAAEILEVL